MWPASALSSVVLPGPGRPGDHDVAARPDGPATAASATGRAAMASSGIGPHGEAPDGEVRAVDRERRHHHVDPRPVGAGGHRPGRAPGRPGARAAPRSARPGARSAAGRARPPSRRSRPARSTQTGPGPLTSTSVTAGSSQQGLEQAEPVEVRLDRGRPTGSPRRADATDRGRGRARRSPPHPARPPSAVRASDRWICVLDPAHRDTAQHARKRRGSARRPRPASTAAATAGSTSSSATTGAPAGLGDLAATSRSGAGLAPRSPRSGPAGSSAEPAQHERTGPHDEQRGRRRGGERPPDRRVGAGPDVDHHGPGLVFELARRAPPRDPAGSGPRPRGTTATPRPTGASSSARASPETSGPAPSHSATPGPSGRGLAEQRRLVAGRIDEQGAPLGRRPQRRSPGRPQ